MGLRPSGCWNVMREGSRGECACMGGSGNDGGDVHFSSVMIVGSVDIE